MNVLILLAALLPWATGPADALFRIFLAVGILSIEMQIVTLAGVGSLPVLPFVNSAAALAIVLWERRRAPTLRWTMSLWTVAPWPAVAALACLVLALNVILPVEAADPYHLDRVAQIERFGTLAYDPAADPKINLMGWVYELGLADVRLIPIVGPLLVQLHGVFGLLLYLLALATARGWLDPTPPIRPIPPSWPWIALLVVPVVFHQFVLIKNDLFLAVPAFVALVWLVTRPRQAPLGEIARVGALIGFVVGTKLTNLPLALILAAGVYLARRPDVVRPLGALAAGGIVGAVAGGLGLWMILNTRMYGDPMASGPVAEIGNFVFGPVESLKGVVRFAVSLFDLGLVSTRVWPDRGGWGSTFGLPFIWAVAVLAMRAETVQAARWTLVAAGAHFLAFAATFPDAMVAHRLALASGMLVVAVAVHLVSRGEDRFSQLARRALVVVIALSAAQIVRSALLYLGR